MIDNTDDYFAIEFVVAILVVLALMWAIPTVTQQTANEHPLKVAPANEVVAPTRYSNNTQYSNDGVNWVNGPCYLGIYCR